MSDMIRGLPLGQQSTSQIYQAPPSGLQTIGALGTGAYGLSKLFGAEGGLMKSYADGGAIKTYAGDQGSVTSEYNIADIINKLSPEQLQQAKEAALNRRDVQTAEMIDQRLAELAQSKSLSAGLGSAFDNLPTEQQEGVMSAANGGIVAFADEGLVEDGDAVEVDPETQQEALAKIQGIQYKQMTPQQRKAIVAENRKALEEAAGPSPYADYRKQIEDMAAEDTKGLEQAKGLAALAAIPAILQGGNAMRGIGAGLGAFGGAYGQAFQANNSQKRSLMSMRMNLAEAERKERMGLNREALALSQQASKDHHNAQMFGLEKAKAMSIIAARTKPTAARPNFDIDSRNLIAADLKSTTPMRKGESPEQYETRLQAMAAREIYGAKGTKDITSRSNITSNVTSNQLQDKGPGSLTSTAEGTESKEVGEGVKNFEAIVGKLVKNPDEKAIIKHYADKAGGDMAKAARAYAEDTRVTPKAATSGAPTAAPAPRPAPAAALPPAALAQLKEGQVTTFTNGQQWKLQNGKPVKVN
jgi:hypothetical protein